MSEYMTSERQEYIDKLDSQIQAIDRILKMDSGTVLNSEIKRNLLMLKDEAAAVLKKLKYDEFEIAIVGQEKAGKSTFANALMKNNLLPSKDLRCTFTSTRIEYCGDNQAENAVVSFYNTETFNKDFKDKLSKIDFPNYERYDFDTLDLDTYMKIYENEVPDVNKKAYGDSIHEDIQGIINNSSSISGLLGIPEIKFNSDRMRNGDLESYITDESRARAVKQVVIKSKELFEMQNAIIFDVPGFNSPTELHKIQTRERMKSADAIIVVANGISPSLTGEEIKILRESDNDGNPLSDKTFVFANKIEGARDIKQNISDTIDQWTSKGFVLSSKTHRIIFGSALTYLQRNGLDKDDRVKRQFEERETELPDGDGIEKMREILRDYNHSERFEVLKRRINRIKADINNTFIDIGSQYNSDNTCKSYGQEHVDLLTDLTYEVRPLIEKALQDLKNKIKNNIPKNRPLSEQITQYIQNTVTPKVYCISEEEILDANRQNNSVDTFEDVARIEGKVREYKFKKMYSDFSKNVINIADNFHNDYSNQIIEIILNKMEVSEESPYYDEIKESLRNELSCYRVEMGANNITEIYYQSLIERFSRDIYEILILMQYNSERLRKFYSNVDNFFSMSVFYRTSDCEDELSYINKTPQELPFCMMLLFHHYLNFADNLKLFISDVSRMTGLKDLSKNTLSVMEKAFLCTGVNKDFLIEKVTEEITKSKALEREDQFRELIIIKVLERLINENEPCSISDKEEFVKYYDRYHSTIRNGKLYSLEDFINDFNEDIQVLQDVLLNAFVRAVCMEKPFVARETKSIDEIIDYIKSNEFGKFLSRNFWKIKYQETTEFDKKHREQEQNAAIMNEIKGILASIEN